MKSESDRQPSGRLLRVGRGETSYEAFVPNPLPPKLEPNWALSRQTSAADRALSELSGLARTLVSSGLLVAPFIRREAVLSSQIEGTKSGLAELYSYEAGQPALPGMEKPEAREEDAHEVWNYVEALQYALRRRAKLPVSLRLIREIHARLMKGVRGEHATPGEFRRTQNWIGGRTIKSAVYVPPPVSEMADALNAFETYLNADDTFPPLVRLALIHYQFEAIHPFVDGNGRIGRLLVALLLTEWNLLPLPLLYLSAYFHGKRRAYYELLLAVSQRGAWPEWVDFFLVGVEEQARDAATRVRKLLDLQANWEHELQKRRVPALTIAAARILLESPVTSPNVVASRLGVSHQTAMQTLRRLEAAGIVRPGTSRKRDRLYVAPEVLRMLE